MGTGHHFMIQEIRKNQKDNLDLNDLSNKHLSIQFSLDGFSFCVLDKDSDTFLVLGEYGFEEKTAHTPQSLLTNIADVFDAESILKESFSSVTVSHVNDLATLVPTPLFDDSKLSSYVEFNNKTLRHDFYAFDELKNHEIVNVYIPYVNVNNFFIDQFGGFEYKHFSSTLVETLFGIYKYSVVPQMFVHVGDRHFEIMVISEKKLQLYNTFSYTTPEDFIYYILFTAEQLKMNPEEFDLKLLGKVEKDDALYEIAFKYVRNIGFLENRSQYSYTDEIDETVKRQYFMLFHQF